MNPTCYIVLPWPKRIISLFDDEIAFISQHGRACKDEEDFYYRIEVAVRDTAGENQATKFSATVVGAVDEDITPCRPVVRHDVYFGMDAATRG